MIPAVPRAEASKLSARLVSAGVAALPDAEMERLRVILAKTDTPDQYIFECSAFLLAYFNRAQLLELDLALNVKQPPEAS